MKPSTKITLVGSSDSRKKILSRTRFIFLLLFTLCVSFSYSQNNKKQEELENRKRELQREMREIKRLSNKDKKKQKSQLTLIEDLNYKISVRNNLIKVTNQQANLLTRNINTNQGKITNLRNDLKVLKNNYANIIVKSYKNKNKHSRIMFLMSASNFKQAYKRLQYMKRYANYQKEQGETIKVKTTELQTINKDLLKQKASKQHLIDENRIAQKQLETERKQHEVLMASIKKNITSYANQIKKKQQESNKIDREIRKIINAAIAASNKKAGKTTKSKTFDLTPKGKKLAANFSANKGKLPWPVSTGVIKTKFGKQPSPIDRSIIIQSNGIRIATDKNAKVKAVFNGEVLQVQVSKRGNPSILIRHGNFISVYKNLKKIYVKKGDEVTTNQEIGEVFTNNNTGESILSFSIFKDTNLQNPAYWLARK